MHVIFLYIYSYKESIGEGIETETKILSPNCIVTCKYIFFSFFSFSFLLHASFSFNKFCMYVDRSLREIYANTQALFVAEPTNFEEAAKKEEWIKAMREELGAINRNETWELVDLPEGKSAIGLKWVFKTKYNADGSIERHKARLVVKGYA